MGYEHLAFRPGVSPGDIGMETFHIWLVFLFFIIHILAICNALEFFYSDAAESLLRGLAGSGGCSLDAVQRLLLAVASLVAEHSL